MQETPEERAERERRTQKIPIPRPWPGDNNELPNTGPTDSEALPDDIEADISQEGVPVDPQSKPISS